MGPLDSHGSHISDGRFYEAKKQFHEDYVRFSVVQQGYKMGHGGPG